MAHRALAIVVFRLIKPPDGEVLTLAPATGLAVAGAVAICAPWLRFVAPLLVGAWIAFPPDGLEPRAGAFIALGAALKATFAPRSGPAA